MQTASFLGVLKLLFYFFLFYYIFKFIMRLLLPVLVKKAVQHAEDNMRNMHERQQQQTTYQKPANDRPSEKKKVGEYIDYEEIE